MTDVLRTCLDDLASRLDEAEEARQTGQWEAFLNDRWTRDVFEPSRRKANPPRVQWPRIRVNAAFADEQAMLLQQFGAVSAAIDGGNAPLNVRCNYGTSIIPSLFGVDLFMMSDESDTLPTSHPLHSTEAIRRLVEAGMPDVGGAMGGRVFHMTERFLDVMERYPVLGRCVEIYHPDVQGPIDIAEIVWGSDMFYAFDDEPQLLRDFLDLITRTYTALMKRWYQLVPPKRDWCTHWSTAHKGRLMIRNDSLMNLPPRIYTEFIRPLDQRLFDEFGGGAIHFCGRGDHFIGPMSQMRGLHAVNLSQPHLNDMETIFRNTVDKGIKIVGLGRAGLRGVTRPLKGQVQIGD